MSDTQKRSVFGRMFGGKTREDPPGDLEQLEDQAPSIHEALAAEPLAETSQDAPRLGWFQRLRHGLTKTSSRLSEGITGVFTKRKLDDETLEELEDLLIQADLGL